MMEASRRAILKSIGLIGLAATMPDSLGQALAQETDLSLPLHWNGEPLARITGETMNVRAEPTTNSEVINVLYQNDIVRVRRAVEGQTVFLYNNLWLETKYGYMYSSFVQPMHYHLPNVPQAVPGKGRWAEATVPFTDIYWKPEVNEAYYVDTLYYSSIIRVDDLITGEDGTMWYHAVELYQDYYVKATHFRIIPPESLTPLSANLATHEKKIEVNLTQQILTAYERNQPVLRTRIASGREGFETPEGTHYVVDKRPGERMMSGGRAAGDDEEGYNLGGIPFVCYFTWDWVATHGTYWHNDYGQPRSHGCVNVPSRIARWLWRWTTPVADYDELYVRPNNALEGTLVKVYYD